MTSLVRRKGAAVVGAMSLLTLAGAFAATPAVQAAPASGDYTANAASDLVHLNAVNIVGVVNLADITVAPATTAVSTKTTPRVRSHATNVDAELLSAAIDEDLVVSATQTAPPDNANGVYEELLSVPAAPLLTATVTSADAHSRWNANDSCFTTGPLSTSISKVADAVVLPGAASGADLLSLDNANDPSGAVVSTTSARLVKPVGSTNYAVQSSSSTQITSINLADGLVVDVLTAPKVVATATGVAGTAKVDLTQPVLRVNGETYLAGEDLAPIAIPGGPVLELSVGQLTKTVAANGTSASGSGYLLSLKVLDVTGTLTLATLTVGDVSAAATAPLGGVVCGGGDDPLRDARKDASAKTVNPGQTFDYTITVPNRGTSDLTNVKVVDTVTGSPALELEKAVPAPTSTSGSTYTFSLGTIAPNQVKTITLSFRVPQDAPLGTKYSNKAVITATYAGSSVSKTVTTPYPTVDAEGSGPCDLSRSTKFASHLRVMPGERFTYYVNAFNQGGDECTNTVVKDTLIDGVAFVSCTKGCTHSGQVVTWKVGTLAPGASVQLAVTVRTTATTGTLPNEADVTADDGEPGHPTTAGPTIGNVSVLAPSNPASRADIGDTGGLARTGASTGLALTGLAALAAAWAVRRRTLLG